MDASKTTVNRNDLKLTAQQTEQLRDMALRVRQKPGAGWLSKVMPRLGRRGVMALFAGCNATGKILAAELLAKEAGLELNRIDLSQLVGQYIGETEKNLARIFDSAESLNVVLLLDEADALFGKRTDVKDSHDRYANMAINYLLQRMEAHQGVVILATNHREALDNAFVRRLHYVIEFPC